MGWPFCGRCQQPKTPACSAMYHSVFEIRGQASFSKHRAFFLCGGQPSAGTDLCAKWHRLLCLWYFQCLKLWTADSHREPNSKLADLGHTAARHPGSLPPAVTFGSMFRSPLCIEISVCRSWARAAFSLVCRGCRSFPWHNSPELHYVNLQAFGSEPRSEEQGSYCEHGQCCFLAHMLSGNNHCKHGGSSCQTSWQVGPRWAVRGC